jgi:GTPase Era involved in 16S rRNA processing
MNKQDNNIELNTLDDFAACVKEINSKLEELTNEIRESRFYRRNINDAGTNELLVKIENKKDQLVNSKFRILILGEFKKGKSTFINSLLGEEILPAYSMPCTDVINEVVWGKETKIIIKKQNLEEIEIKPIDLEKYVTIKGEHNTDDNKTILAQISHPLEYCKNGVIVLDTPGLNENIKRTSTTLGYLSNADAIIFVLSADQPCSMTEMDTIHSLSVDFGFNNIFFVCNRMNSIREKEKSSLINFMKEKLSKYTGSDSEVHFIDSLSTLENKVLNKEISNEFKKLEKNIQKHLIEKRANLKIKNITGDLIISLNAFLVKIENRKNNIKKDKDVIETNLSQKSDYLNDNQKAVDEVEKLWKKNIDKIVLNLSGFFLNEIKSGTIEVYFKKQIGYICSRGEKEQLSNSEYSKNIFNTLVSEWFKNTYEYKLRPVFESHLHQCFSEISIATYSHLSKHLSDDKKNYLVKDFNLKLQYNPQFQNISNGQYLIIDTSGKQKKHMSGMGIGAIMMAAVDLAFTGGGVSLLLSTLSGLGAGYIFMNENDDEKFIGKATAEFVRTFNAGKENVVTEFENLVKGNLKNFDNDFIEILRLELKKIWDSEDLLKQDLELDFEEKEKLINDIEILISKINMHINSLAYYQPKF